MAQSNVGAVAHFGVGGNIPELMRVFRPECGVPDADNGWLTCAQSSKGLLSGMTAAQRSNGLQGLRKPEHAFGG